MKLRGLPDEVVRLCEELNAPGRLVAHLQLVHDVAACILDAVSAHFPNLKFDRESVLFGAASHDIGKVVHSEELTGPGKLHEAAGEKLLIRHGISVPLARFARTHGNWDRDTDVQIEDLMVAVADKVWKGVRKEELEELVCQKIAEELGLEGWEVFSVVDEVLDGIASGGEERLAWQRRE
ncbi:MAG: HD domain-containing protein [Planctomycetaceae bacterium]|nr:HD domain-containing protein [Planctomycetaceae bacterium]